MKKYNEFEILKKSKSVCIIGHIDPDADVFCSMVVLKNVLSSKFKKIKIELFAEMEMLAENYKEILGNNQTNGAKKDFDVAIMIDCPNTDRLGVYKDLFYNAKTTIVVDHHDTNKKQGNFNIVQVCSSACEIVFEIGEAFGYKFTNADYGKIYAGIITDTGNFSVGKVGERTYQIASKCVSHIDYEKVYRSFFANNTAKNMRLFALAINNMKTFEDDRIVITHITKEDAKKLKIVADDYTGIINRISTIGSSRLVAFIHPKKEEYYVSMRARLGYDVSKIAVRHGGGGHVGAAAYLAKDSITKIEEELKNLFEEELKSKTEERNKLF